MSRINISKETRAQIEFFASAQGHNNLSAALATIVKLGLPFLLNGTTAVVAQPPPAISYLPQPQQEAPITDDQPTDATIARLSLLLEEF